MVRVLPDEPAIGKAFDYLVPDDVGDQVRVGTRVRIALGPRRVGGWVVETDVASPPGVKLRPLAKMSGWGPTPDLVALADWAAWRWAGKPASFLRTASPERNVMALPTPAVSRPAPGPVDPLIAEAFELSARLTRPPGTTDADVAVQAGRPTAASPWVTGPASSGPGGPRVDQSGAVVLRLPPAADPSVVAVEAARRGNALVLCPTAEIARAVGTGLRRAGVSVASHPRDWGLGTAGATVVGTRAAAWTPVGDLAAVVVVDEHDEAHAQEQAPTWNARDVAIERARRAGVPCVLVSPCPSLEALAAARLLEPSRNAERAGWPIVDVVDRRHDDPRTGLFSPRLTDLLRTDRRVVCVLNRTGRARLLACAACGELARCERCDAAVTQPTEGELVCPRCEQSRPVVCLACGATRLKLIRQGVSRVREELEALVGEPVGEVTATASDTGTRVVVGTEAVLHQVHRADVVAFLDLDQELLAPRYRAVEQALALVVRGARLLGGKDSGGRLLLQTRLSRHEVVLAALHGDPTRVSAAEAERRRLLRFPPESALAELSGPAAGAYAAALSGQLGVEVIGPADGRWLVRAPEHHTLCDALAATPRPPGRSRLSVDPLRV